MDFYNDVLDKKFDIRLFEQSFRKPKWCPLQVIGFLAFGTVLKEVDVTGLLANDQKRITRPELMAMAKKRGMKG